MEEKEEQSARRPQRRPVLYVHRVGVDVTREQLRRIDRVADRYELSRAEVARRCLDIALPLLRDRLRKEQAKYGRE